MVGLLDVAGHVELGGVRDLLGNQSLLGHELVLQLPDASHQVPKGLGLGDVGLSLKGHVDVLRDHLLPWVSAFLGAVSSACFRPSKEGLVIARYIAYLAFSAHA